MNMQKIGRKICEQRKAKDMTQVELADSLHVSYQAVSSWERGLTMPDVSKLPDISQVLGVSIDELLDSPRQAEIVRGVLSGQITEADTAAGSLYLDEVEEIAPILKPKQMDELARASQFHSIGEIAGLAPFISRDVLDEMARAAADTGGIEELASIAPFVSREIIDELALKSIKNGNISELCNIAPFISKNILDELAQNSANAENISEIYSIAPFVSRNILDGIARRVIDVGSIHEIHGLAPFISRHILDELARKVTASYAQGPKQPDESRPDSAAANEPPAGLL